MSRPSNAERAVLRLAQELVQLAAAVRAVDALQPGSPRTRAALAVLRAHVELSGALPDERGVEWMDRGRGPLERALLVSGGCMAVSLLDAARSGEWRRVELLLSGQGLRGRGAELYRIAVELETRPDRARAVANDIVGPWGDEARRLAETGILRVGSRETFVSRIDADVDSRFPASRVLAARCARYGAHAAFLRVSRRLGSVDPVLEVASLFASGVRSAALGRLARLSSVQRESALLALVILELRQSGSRRAEAFAQKLSSPKKRAWAFGAIVHQDAMDLVVRRDLARELSELSPLEYALLSAEMGVAKQSPTAVFRALDAVGRLLVQVPPQARIADFDNDMPSAWERALRCAFWSLLSGKELPDTLRFPKKALFALTESQFLRCELESVVTSNARALESLVSVLPARYAMFAHVMRGLAVHARVRHLRPGERIRALPPVHELAAPSNRHAAIVAGALWPNQVRELSSSALCPIRAAFDYGVALSPASALRQRVLVNAAKASLRALDGPEHSEVVQLRMSTLRQLDGAGVSDVAMRILLECELSRTTRIELLDLVARNRDASASRFVWSNFARVTNRGRDASAVLAYLERSGTMEPGTATAWAKLALGCSSVDACDWWAGFVEGWRQAFQRHASHRLLAACGAAMCAGELPNDGAEAAKYVVRAIEATVRCGLARAFAEKRASDIEWVLLAHEPDLQRSWSVARWHEVTSRLSKAGSADPSVVTRLVSELCTNDGSRTEAMLAGTAPTPELRKPIDIGHGMELMYLDKQRDMLSFLRIADPVACCYSSDGPHYDGNMRTSRWILRMHRDPLSYGFHVRRTSDGTRVGFTFGGFALVREPALVLNGIYLRRQDRGIRTAILDAIEHAFARPLGVVKIGVAATHGGSGPLPPEYKLETRRGVRLRALRDLDGHLQRDVYDDISDAVNTEVDLELHFKDLSSSVESLSL